jgi:hypothetical protein
VSNLPTPPRTGDTPDDHERQTMVRRIQGAMVDGYIGFDEIDDRFDAIYRAETRADLAAVAADLPVPSSPEPPTIGHPLPMSNSSVFGDIKVGGWVEVAGGEMSCSTVFGDTVLDLSTAKLPAELFVRTSSVFGDLTVIVPDGARAVAEGMTIFGSRTVDLSPPREGGPLVRVKLSHVFGDIEMYSLSRLPEGKFRKMWRRLRESFNPSAQPGER